MKEYIVTLRPDADPDGFWSEMENHSNGLPFVPDRPVDIVNARLPMRRQCHYALTDEEADALKQDPRVRAVEVPVSKNPIVEIGLYNQQNGNFTKPPSPPVTAAGDAVNWGLIRHQFDFNPYGAGRTTPLNFKYVLDGTGVDVVVVDSGIQADHPEFQDAMGQSRVVEYDWYAETGIPGTLPSGFYTDEDGHGTACAGIMAGKTYGWAKNAAIYSIQLEDLGPNGISYEDMIDVLLVWHQNKTVDPTTGFKRPTVVNMSFGYGIPQEYFLPITTRYREQFYNNVYGLFLLNLGQKFFGPGGNFTGQIPYRIDSVDDGIDALTESGMTVCIASGNSGQKIALEGQTDYYNYMFGYRYIPQLDIIIAIDLYYMQGSSPYSESAIMCGALDSVVYNNSPTIERKTDYSNTGPGVPFYAAGQWCMSAYSTQNSGGYVADYQGGPYQQTLFNGTSCAAPQTAGQIAVYLQSEPEANAADVQQWLLRNGKRTGLYTGGINDYADDYSQLGGTSTIITQPIIGQAYVKTSSITWQPLDQIKVKVSGLTWTNVKIIWTKTSEGTWQKIYQQT